MNGPWSRIRDLLVRLLGFAWFAFLATGMVRFRALPLLRRPIENADFVRILVGVGLDVLFYAMVATIFLVRRDAIQRAPGFWPRLAGFLGAFGLLYLGYLPTRSEPGIVWTAAILGVCAHLWMVLSLLWLGRNFSIFPEARGLVVTGPYRVVRHPLYLGEMLAAISLMLLHLHPAAILGVVLWIPIQVYRAMVEERVLESTWPEYVSYRQRVRRLIPGVW